MAHLLLDDSVKLVRNDPPRERFVRISDFESIAGGKRLAFEVMSRTTGEICAAVGRELAGLERRDQFLRVIPWRDYLHAGRLLSIAVVLSTYVQGTKCTIVKTRPAKHIHSAGQRETYIKTVDDPSSDLARRLAPLLLRYKDNVSIARSTCTDDEGIIFVKERCLNIPSADLFFRASPWETHGSWKVATGQSVTYPFQCRIFMPREMGRCRGSLTMHPLRLVHSYAGPW